MENSAKRRRVVQEEAAKLSLFGLEHLPVVVGERRVDLFGKVSESDRNCLILLAPQDVGVADISHLMGQAGTLLELEALKVAIPLSGYEAFSLQYEKHKDCKRALRIRSQPAKSLFKGMYSKLPHEGVI